VSVASLLNALLASYDSDLSASTFHERMKSGLAARGFVRQGQEWDGLAGCYLFGCVSVPSIGEDSERSGCFL
jgi:hypothetical protein